jgi:hypothetical protein
VTNLVLFFSKRDIGKVEDNTKRITNNELTFVLLKLRISSYKKASKVLLSNNVYN